MAKKTKPRLGRGLSGLIGDPVKVETTAPTTTAMAEPDHNPITNGHSEAAASESDGRFKMIEVKAIHPNKFQPRRKIEEESLDALAASIRQSGVMQPIAVRPGTGTDWELIAGERRWRAATKAGLSEVPALIVDIDDQEAAEWAIVENVQREDLNPVDRALAYRRLVDEFDMTHGQIAERAGIDRSTVANLIRIVDLEPPLLELVASGALQVGHAKVLLSLPPGQNRVTLGTTAAATNMTVRQMVDEIEEMVRPKKAVSAAANSMTEVKPRQYAALERQLGDHLGTKVRIQHKGKTGRGKVTIEYFDLEHFDALMSAFGFQYES